jgi:hypothetical protein
MKKKEIETGVNIEKESRVDYHLMTIKIHMLNRIKTYATYAQTDHFKLREWAAEYDK